MGAIRDVFVYFFLSPVFATAIGLVVGLIVFMVARGAASRIRSRPFILLAVGYAVLALGTVFILADGDGERRVGPFVGTALSFVLAVYLRHLLRRRQRASSRQAGDRPRFPRRSGRSKPDAGAKPGAETKPGAGRRPGADGDGAYTGTVVGPVTGVTGPGRGATDAGIGIDPGAGAGGFHVGDTDADVAAAWLRGLPRPTARPPSQLPLPGAGGPGWSGPGALGPGGFGPGGFGPGGFGPDDRGDGTDDEPPHGPPPPPRR